MGVSATPPASGSKSAVGSRDAAKLQKELPPVAFLQQRHIGFRLCGLSAYCLTPWTARGLRLSGNIFLLKIDQIQDICVP